MKPKQTVVFLHGWGMNANIWQPFFDSAQDMQFETIAIDLPGYGEHRQYENESKTLQSMAKFIDRCIKTECVILGWSLGGLVAKLLAHSNPAKYRKVITVCSSPFFIEDNDWVGMKSKVLRFFAEELVIDHNQLLRRFVAIQTMGLADALVQNKLIMKHVFKHEPPSNEVLKNGLLILEKEDVRSHTAEINVPHLAVFGKLDSLVPKAAISKIAELNENMQVVTFDKASHAPFLSHPESFLQTLQQFVDNP